MRFLTKAVPLFALALSMAACGGKTTSSSGCCADFSDCDAGFVCVSGSCEQLCSADSDCETGEVCTDDTCQIGARTDTPVVDSVDSNGAPDPDPSHAGHHLNEHVILSGSFLEGASVRLTGPSRDEELEVCSSTDLQLVAMLPTDIGAGEYSLYVSNQSGGCNAPISLLQGAPGNDGANGSDGATGPQGPSGPAGVPCNGCVDTATLDSSVYAGNGSADTLARSDHSHTKGVIYERWGRATCPTGASLVYAGVLVGKHQTHGGGGSNPLCASTTPNWLDYDSGNQNGNLIYGAEYQTSGYAVGAALTALHDAQVPCAVCMVDTRSMKLMMPGNTNCPTGWTNEYSGYLMGFQYQQASGDTLCIDQNPIASTFGGGTGNEDGYLLYFTEGECGSLPCGAGQYVQNREITCSVCTR